ncbi:MAG: hypothetical protein R3310_00170 [Candidatus Competibacteraceae bacterium]|nr:hypothetical protein [Candidatus Competibacteraceae bacterium]
MKPLSRCWRGDLPLPVVYWLWGVGGNMSLLALLVVLWAGGASPWLLWPVYLISLGWFVPIFFGIWRSAGTYGGPRIWAVLARAGVIVGIFRMALEFLGSSGTAVVPSTCCV